MEEKENRIYKKEASQEEDVISFIQKYEGSIPHMYLDTKGNVTIGTGFLIHSEDDTRKIPLRFISDTGGFTGMVTYKDAKEAYRKIKNLPFGKDYPASYYHPHYNKEEKLGQIGMDGLTIRKILEQKLNESERELRVAIPRYDSLPFQVKKGLIDMQYNMGVRKFNSRRWPKLFAAIDGRDYEAMAKESHRRDVQSQRNKDVYNLFLSAKDPRSNEKSESQR
jgi:GH24 family phage-related lysozyme (muramidase)